MTDRPPTVNPMQHIQYRSLIGTLVLNLLVTGASHAQSQPAAMAVEVIKPTQGGVNRIITLPGTVKALQEATLYAKVGGYLKTIHVDKGDSVKAGALIANLEAPELSADLTRYRAEATAAKAEYERMQQALQKAPDLVMPVELDRAKGKYDVAEANVERNLTLLGYARITAPFSGVVTRRYADPGAFIPAASAGGSAQSAAVVTLMDFNSVRVQVAVPAAEAALVKKGLPVNISAEGLAGRHFEGKISRYAYALDDGSRTMLAEIELDNPSLELRPGMYASVKIGIERHEQALLIPSAALVMEKTNAFTYTVVGGVARKKPIKTGFNDGSRVEILEGIAADDRVILIGKKSMSDGLAVQVTEVP